MQSLFVMTYQTKWFSINEHFFFSRPSSKLHKGKKKPFNVEGAPDSAGLTATTYWHCITEGHGPYIVTADQNGEPVAPMPAALKKQTKRVK